jgi:amiloride-sensitive sodium channel
VDSRAIDFIEEASPALSEVIFRCMWRLNGTACNNLFTSVLTDEGLCYTFNTLSSKDLFRSDTIQHNSKYLNHSKTLTWSLEGGYPDSQTTETFPDRALTSGAYGGLYLLVGMDDKDIDPLCSYAIHGLQVLLHSPADFPNVEAQQFWVPLNRHVIVGIRPRLMVTNAALRGYPPEKRRCYFATERHLRHFSIYTQQNCGLECFTNYTLQKCGCVWYHMPRDQNTSICGPAKQECLINGAVNFMRDGDGLFKCNCMSACTEISYDVETSQAKYNWLENEKVVDPNYAELETKRFTAVSFYYKDLQFVSSRRGELYGPAEFLASCGGLLGLCMGFSLLSLVEIIYFFTVRLFCNVQANKKKHLAP